MQLQMQANPQNTEVAGQLESSLRRVAEAQESTAADHIPIPEPLQKHRT